MKNLLLGCGLSLLMFVGCSNEDVVTDNVPNQLITRSAESMRIENGTLVFPDYDSYYNVLNELHQLNSEDLLQWNERMDYKSMLTKDYNSKNFIEVIDNEEEELEKESELDDVRKTLYSDKGLLIIGDTLYKVIDDYIYQIPMNSQISLSDVESAPENYQNIRFKHTINLKMIPSKSTYSTRSSYVEAVRQGNDESRSHLVEVSSKRREHVKFIAGLSVDNHWIFLNVGMRGRAQKKTIGIWGNTFNDEMAWGQGIGYVTINNGIAKPNIIIPRVENAKESFNNVLYPLAPVGQLLSCQITANYDFYKNDVAKEQHYVASFSLN